MARKGTRKNTVSNIIYNAATTLYSLCLCCYYSSAEKDGKTSRRLGSGIVISVVLHKINNFCHPKPSSPSSDSPSHDRLVATADRPPEETHKDLGPYFPRRVGLVIYLKHYIYLFKYLSLVPGVITVQSLRLGPNSIPTTGALYTSRLRRVGNESPTILYIILISYPSTENECAA